MGLFRYILSRALPRGSFAKSVITLMTGTGLAQLLPLLLSPILTRLYTPEEFGVFALYASICAVLVVFVTGKYELAIVVPKTDSEAVNLVVISMLLSFTVSFLFLMAILIWNENIADLLGHPELRRWLYLIPLATLILGCYHSLNFWANRRIRYKDMAVSRIVQSGSSGVVQLGAGFSKWGLAGLMVGQICGQLLSTLFLALSINRYERNFFRRVSFKRMRCVARKYIKYPKYMVSGQAMNVGGSELPLLLLAIFFGAGVAGFYSLAQRVMMAPLSLVANAIGDVYRQRAAEDYNLQGQCTVIFLASLKRLLLFAFIPMLPILFLGPTIFSFVFGEEWRAAGEVAVVISFLMFFQTIYLPLSSTVVLRGWLLLDSVWNLIRVLSVIIVFFVCDSLGVGYMVSIGVHVLVCSSLYIVHSLLQYRAAAGYISQRGE